MKERIRWIDIAKGICMLAVILGHLGVPQWGFVYSFHLTVFFILSGYTLKSGPINKEWLKNKFRRLMTPYFITCAAVAGMGAVNNLVLYKTKTIAAFTNTLFQGLLRSFFASGGSANLGKIWMGPQIGIIGLLPAMYFALIFARLILNKIRGVKWQILCGIGIAAVGCVSAELIRLPFSIQSAMLATPFILLGCYLREGAVLEKIKWWHLPMMAAVFAAGCYMKWHPIYYVNCSAANWFFSPILAIISSLLILALCRWIKKCPPLEWFGIHSMTALCAHLFELNTLHPYYKALCLRLGIPYTKPIVFIAEMLVILSIMGLLQLLKKRSRKQEGATLKNGRSLSIDIMRSILIISMIVGHLTINAGLRRVIYSIHMMAFVMISGYFYNDRLPFGQQLKKCLKMLLPYGVAALAAVFLLKTRSIGDVLLGMSYSRKLLPEVPNVGAVYFILLLFLVRLVYSLLKTRSDLWRTCLVFSLAAVGLWLGKEGYWLPWSLDCALVALIFYHLGYGLRKHKVLERCREWPILYFLFATLWAYFIHKGAMEIAVRKYGDMGITLVGVFGGFMVLYQVCSYFEEHWPAWFSRIFSIVGQSTAWILVFHTLFNRAITQFLEGTFKLYRQNIGFLFVYVVSQVLIGVLIHLLVEWIKKMLGKCFTKA